MREQPTPSGHIRPGADDDTSRELDALETPEISPDDEKRLDELLEEDVAVDGDDLEEIEKGDDEKLDALLDTLD